jgi:hypothetical protein
MSDIISLIEMYEGGVNEHESDFLAARTGRGEFQLKAVYSHLAVQYSDVYCHPKPYVAPPALRDLVGPNLKVGGAKWNDASNTADAVAQRLAARPGPVNEVCRSLCASDR